MALQQSTTTSQGLTASSAYIKIVDYHGDKDILSVSVEVFFDEQARIDGKRPLEHLMFETSTPTTDLLPALYAYLKTLDQFSGAVDV